MDARTPILALATFAAATQTLVFVGVLADLAEALGVSVAVAGQLTSAFALTFAVSAPLTASLLAGTERRGLLVFGLLAVSVLNLGAAVAPSFEILLGLRVGAALAGTLVAPVALSAAAALAPPERRGAALATVLAGFTLAFTLGIPVGSALGGAFGWRATFGLASGLALVAAVAIRAVLPRVESEERAGLSNLKAMLAPPVLAPLSITAGSFLSLFTVVAYIGPVVTRTTGLEGAGVGAMQAFVGIGSIFGIIVGGRAADSAPPRAAVLGCLAASATSLALYSAWPTIGAGLPAEARIAGLAGTILLGAAALFALGPVVQARLVEAADGARNVALATNGSMVFLGQGLGAAVGGAVIGARGVEPLGLVGASLALLTAGLAFGLPRRRPEPAH